MARQTKHRLAPKDINREILPFIEAPIVSEISPAAFELRESKAAGIAQLSYRLVEDSVNGLYGFVIEDDGTLQVAIYFDDESDIDLARTVFDSIKKAPQ